jgi:hypothetical protein
MEYRDFLCSHFSKYELDTEDILYLLEQLLVIDIWHVNYCIVKNRFFRKKKV